ncbi:hypothetical protein [Nocardiopsis metallicus]|uniref:Uncharacterized protein n=1 Tax=Nocardiopsis metallicus TaxID=179819 RepID=A0A840WDI1_9ACTN|nr:hypothetical protein [Nocardiopsis metallicus]MBB5494222.1 hypothetical protein [Nocardiopsis metallicus]
MAYPSEDEILRCDSVLTWIDDNFLRNDPYSFKDTPDGFRSTAALIANSLEVDRNGIFCIGSGAIGLSLNPSKAKFGKLKRFDIESDIDLAVISEYHFETAWRDLRKASQPTLGYMEELVRDNISWQRRRLFDGTILAHKLLPALSFGPSWMTALVGVEEHISRLLDREISLGIWIYRDYWSLRNYVSDGLVKCRRGMYE